MDHLPTPIDGVRAKVQFLAKHKIYRPNDFFTIRQQMSQSWGYADAQKLMEVGLPRNQKAETKNKFLQEWLFFGLLA
jgi:hypothetical protein